VPECDGLIQRHCPAAASIRRIYRSQQRAGTIGIKNLQLMHFNRMKFELLNSFNA
jgi:hypothetical protein